MAIEYFIDIGDIQVNSQTGDGAVTSRDEPFIVPSKDIVSPERAMQSSARKFSPLQCRPDFINRDHSAVSHGKALLNSMNLWSALGCCK